MQPVSPRVRFGLPAPAISFGALLALALPALGQSSSDMGFPRGSGDRSTLLEPGPRILERCPVFFPPNPPPLDRPPARGIPPGGQYPAPAELAAYVPEFFYPALGTRLATGTLPSRLRGELESYRRAKRALQTKLRAELQRLRDVDPATRRAALATLARQQTPKIAELERRAEQLRRELVTSDNNWSAVRQWHLSERPRRGFSPIEIAQVMRAYAFYENHLLPAQRRLLREISIELVFAAEDTAAATAAQPYLFFPPEPARVLLPDNLTPELARKVAAYQTKKSALKKELYDAVQASDGAAFGFFRGPMKSLAEKQAPRLAELDVLAEEIREGLSQIMPGRSERSPLSPELDARVVALIVAYHAAQDQAVNGIEQILARAKDLPMQASYRFDGENVTFLVVPTRGARGGRPSAATLSRIEEVRAAISSVADDYGRRVVDLINERESIRQAIGEAFHLAKAEEIDRVLVAAMRVANQRRAESSFSEYRVAVFEPGLSPEQRRLLFDGVLESFNLPLPRGELQPAARAETW